MTRKIIAAFRDNEQKCVFVRYEGGVIDMHSLNGDDMWRWLGDPDDDRNPDPDPDGIVWAALTGQRPNEALASAFEASRIERIRAAARRVQNTPDISDLLVEIFAP